MLGVVVAFFAVFDDQLRSPDFPDNARQKMVLT